MTPDPARTLVDRLVAGALLLLLVPLLLVLGLAIRASSEGPAIFRQVRVGRDGRRFTLFKLRTMELDAEERFVDFAGRNDCDRVLFKLRDDPRTTGLGRFLRRYSLDELPQLWNVVRGEMALVGPRPALPSEVEMYDPVCALRLRVRPGMTGLVQVSGRADLPWAEAVELDLEYVQHRSAGLDVRILLLTPAAVLSGRGAY